jgi:hypothetical protein
MIGVNCELLLGIIPLKMLQEFEENVAPIKMELHGK